ncbi:MAG: hypothetical protein LM517_01360 [Nitrosomonas sp.]|nr:hypothetical protein [Nitrosomonas sp.]
MEGVILWPVLLSHIEQHYPKAWMSKPPADGVGECVSHLLHAELVKHL